MDIELVETTDALRPVLTSLMSFYQYDFTEFTGEDVGPDGRFAEGVIAHYFANDPERVGFLLRVGGQWAGFVLLKRGALLEDEPETMVVVEFFVLRKYRRSGAGEAMARAIWDGFPGRWEVRQVARNLPAQAFWRSIIGRYTGGRFEERTWEHEGRGGTVQYFVNSERGGG